MISPLWLLVSLEHCRNLILRRFANCNHKNRYSKSHRMNQLLQFSKKIKKRINSYKHMGGISGGTKGDSWLWINIHYCFLVILPLHKTQWSMTIRVVESWKFESPPILLVLRMIFYFFSFQNNHNWQWWSQNFLFGMRGCGTNSLGKRLKSNSYTHV